MEFLFIGGLVEVEVAGQNLVRTFAAQDLRVSSSDAIDATVSCSDGVWVAPDASDATRVATRGTPLHAIFTPMALILRDMRNIGVAALMVVTSYVSK